MNKLLLLLPLLLLTGCESRPIDQRDYTIQRLDNIPELRGCIYLKLDSGNLKVIRCPNSSTITQWQSGGKNPTTYNTTVLD